MRNNPKLRKALILILCAVALVAISVGATIAYLTDTQSVTNTFTVGQVHIKLDETDTDINGVKNSDVRTEAGNEYKLMPGHSYTKDPMVTVKAGSSEAFVRMLVTVNNIADLKAIFPDDIANNTFLLQNFVEGWDNATWVFEDATSNGDDTCTYEFRYNGKTDDLTDVEIDRPLDALFDSFKLPGTVTNEQIKALREGFKFDTTTDTAVAVSSEPKFEITVVAHAIQADGFENDADAAWAAFKTDNP